MVFNTGAFEMMVIVGVTKITGIFQYIAVKLTKMMRCDSRRILLSLALITAIYSALLDNVTTVPMTFSICDNLKLIQINVGGASILIDDSLKYFDW